MKKLSLLFVSTCIALSLGACSSKTETPTEDKRIENTTSQETTKDNTYDVGDFSFVVPEGWSAVEVTELEDESVIKKDEIKLLPEDTSSSYEIYIRLYKDSTIEENESMCKEAFTNYANFDYSVEGKEMSASTYEWSMGAQTTNFHNIFLKDGNDVFQINTSEQNGSVDFDADLFTSIIESIQKN